MMLTRRMSSCLPPMLLLLQQQLLLPRAYYADLLQTYYRPLMKPRPAQRRHRMAPVPPQGRHSDDGRGTSPSERATAAEQRGHAQNGGKARAHAR